MLLFLGILLLAYGGIVAAAGSGSRFFLVWMLGGGMCLGAAAVRAAHLLAGFSKAAGRICLLLVLLGVCGVLLCVGLISTKFYAKAEKGLDYIIVLGAQVHEIGPSRVLASRLDTAAAYLKENAGTLCIVSGGQGYNEPFAEAEGMRRYLEGKGINPARIIMEDQSTDTASNIANCIALAADLPVAKTGIVTSNFHLYRALAIARKKGLPHAQGIAADSRLLYLPNNMLRECFALVKDKLCQNL